MLLLLGFLHLPVPHSAPLSLPTSPWFNLAKPLSQLIKGKQKKCHKETQEVDEVSNCCRLTIVDNYYLQNVVFTSGEGSEAGEAGELPVAGRTSARPRPGAEGQRGCGPEPPRPCPLQDFAGEESRAPARPPGSQTVHCPRAAAAGRSHHNNMQSAARGRPPRRAHCTRLQVPGPGAQSKRGHRDPGGRASRASQVLLAGGLLQHCEMPATGAPQPRPLPTPVPGARGSRAPAPAIVPRAPSPSSALRGTGKLQRPMPPLWGRPRSSTSSAAVLRAVSASRRPPRRPARADGGHPAPAIAVPAF